MFYKNINKRLTISLHKGEFEIRFLRKLIWETILISYKYPFITYKNFNG